MLNIALCEPEIPPNTGNIIRLCANSGAQLHLIHPLGFNLNEKSCRRAGLDYRDLSNITEYQNYSDFIKAMQGKRIFACTTKANAIYTEVNYQDEDVFLFGAETRGLSPEILADFNKENKIKIPMKPNSRSLNLSNSAAIILYEAWRQLNFK